MSTRTTKTAKPKRPNAGVTTATFEPGEFIEFISTGMPLPSKVVDHNHKKLTNGKIVAKKKPNVQDRRYLHDIEIWLNNCVNFAQRLEAKQGAKILQLLTEARERTIRLRG
jgi:hypothetical protein